MLTKNLPVTTALWKIPFRMGLDAVSAWENLLKGDGGYFMAIVKAHMHYLKWMGLHKKRSVFPVKKEGKPLGWYKGLVVWQYFVNKKKTFSEIVDNK